jgi:succinate dehydrogenase/fumarate reductase flavoprotein subunit
MRNRRVYLDFTKNPFGLESINFEKLDEEAYTYLKNAHACFGTPIDRLLKMNTPAVELYRDHAVELTADYLEIALCAQHNNGGVSVDRWWQSDVKGLFAAGECAGTHGITRPGGSALNAGQVGSLRAAQYIGACDRKAMDASVFEEILEKALGRNLAFCEAACKNPANIASAAKQAQERMSSCGGAIRELAAMEATLEESLVQLKHFGELFGIESLDDAELLYRLRDILIVQAATLTAMINYAKEVKLSRGSALYRDENGRVAEGLEEIFRFSADDKRETEGTIGYVFFKDGIFEARRRERRPLPQNDDFFENVWRSYRENQNID